MIEESGKMIDKSGKMIDKRRRVLVAGLLWLVAAACVPIDSAPPRVGDEAPDFEAVSLADDSRVSFSDYRGNVVLLNLWATWCAPCRYETPYLQSVHEKYSERGLKIVGVSVDLRTSRDAVEEFLAENEVTYDQLLDPDGMTTDIFGAIGLPATFLIDAEGTIVFNRLGPILDNDPGFLKALEDALQ